MINFELANITLCECGEELSATAKEVINFDSVECPSCGTDVYYTDEMYQEANDVDREYELSSHDPYRED